jgi:hypothetical protein
MVATLLQKSHGARLISAGAEHWNPYKSMIAKGQSRRFEALDGKFSTVSQNSAWTPDSWA